MSQRQTFKQLRYSSADCHQKTRYKTDCSQPVWQLEVLYLISGPSGCKELSYLLYYVEKCPYNFALCTKLKELLSWNVESIYECYREVIQRLLRAGRFGVRTPIKARFSSPIRTAMGLIQPSVQLALGFLGGKAAGAWSWPPTPILRHGSRKSRAISVLPHGVL